MDKSKINITGRRQNSIEGREWQEPAVKEYCKIVLSDFVIDSLVNEIYFKQDVVEAINDWVEQSVAAKGVTPEVGGLLLGEIKPVENRFQLKVEVFAPFQVVNSQSSIRIEVSEGIAFAYNDAIAKYPELPLIGWFHTHPGHGPFLSVTDLNQTQFLFKEPYHVAMVLDSLTKPFETGIFSKKSDGSMNNAKDYTEWIPWKALLNKQSNE